MSENFNVNQPQPLPFKAAANEALNNAENTSGRGENAKVPESVANKFNWGAFLFNWIWGLGNKCYITLIIFAVALFSFIPFIGWIALIGCQVWFGMKGNEWAWRNKKWINEEHFHQVQKTWAIAGAIFSVISILITIVCVTIMVASMMSSMSDVGAY